MKYLILIPDGMADTPNAVLDNKTPMEKAAHPTMDMLAKKSRCGTVLNVPEGMVPESAQWTTPGSCRSWDRSPHRKWDYPGRSADPPDRAAPAFWDSDPAPEAL